MLHKFLFSILLLFTFSFVYAQNESGKLFVFTIGISNYYSVDFEKLPNATLDADSIQSVLVKKYGGEVYPRSLRNEMATKDNIVAYLKQMAKGKTITEDDNLLIWFSGHGQYDKFYDKGFLITYDISHSNELYGNALSYNEIVDLLKPIKAKHILLISDACYSGSIFLPSVRGINNESLSTRMEEKSRYAITSSNLTEASDGTIGKHSPFTQLFLEKLRNNKNKYLSSEEIANYLEYNLPSIAGKVKDIDKNDKLQTIRKGRILRDYDKGGVFTLYNPNGVNNLNLKLNIPISTSFNTQQLRIGVVNYKGKEALDKTFVHFTEFLSKKINRTPHLEIVEYENLAKRLNSGEFAIGVFSPFAYIKAKKNYPDLEIFATHEAKGRNGYYGVILANKDSDIETLMDLKGKKFLFVHSRSTSGYQYPMKYFRENGIEPNRDFFDYSFSGSHSKSLKSLINREVDAIATYKEALYDYEKTYSLSDFKIIYESKIIPYNAYVFAPNLDNETKELIKSYMFNAHNYSENSAMFDNPLKINKWLPCTDEFYNPLRDYLNIGREKKGIDLKIEIKGIEGKGIKDNIQSILIFELENSKRFNFKENNNEKHFLKLVINALDENNFLYFVYLNSIPISRGKIKNSELFSDLPILIVNEVLSKLPIETTIDFDGKIASVPFGADDGINDNYKFIVFNNKGEEIEKLSASDLKIRQPNTLLPESYSYAKNIGLKVIIQYYKPDDNNNQTSVISTQIKNSTSSENNQTTVVNTQIINTKNSGNNGFQLFDANQKINFYSGTKYGTFNSIVNNLVNVLDDSYKIKNIKSLGSYHNAKIIDESDEFQLALSQTDLLIDFKNIYPLLYLYESEMHLVVLKSSNINSINDTKGLNVAAGYQAKEGRNYTAHLLSNKLNLNWNFIEGDISKDFDNLSSGKVDIVFFIAGVPTKYFAVLHESAKKFFKLVNLNSTSLDSIYHKCIIKKGSYTWVSDDIQSYSVPNAIIVNKRFIDNEHNKKELNKFIQVLRDNISDLEKYGHPKWKDFINTNKKYQD